MTGHSVGLFLSNTLISEPFFESLFTTLKLRLSRMRSIVVRIKIVVVSWTVVILFVDVYLVTCEQMSTCYSCIFDVIVHCLFPFVYNSCHLFSPGQLH